MLFSKLLTVLVHPSCQRYSDIQKSFKMHRFGFSVMSAHLQLLKPGPKYLSERKKNVPLNGSGARFRYMKTKRDFYAHNC